MHRVALTVAYNGSRYHGWQYQGRDIPTVQRELTNAVSKVADNDITLHCAGRTDTGVHASKQIVHFDSPVDRPDKAWIMGSNANLPDSVSVEWAGTVQPDFDARRSATARRYLYLIHNVRVRSSLMHEFLTHEHCRLDHDSMHEAAQSLLGENDFSSFRAANCQSVSPMRNLMEISVYRRHDVVAIEVVANAFLQHMVRNIAGSLMAIGTGYRSVEWLAEVLDAKDRSKAARTAPPNGLSLVDVVYPEAYGIPAGPATPHLFRLLGEGL